MTATTLAARVLEQNYARLLRKAETRGYRHTTFGGDDILQLAATRFWSYAQSGKYDNLDEGGLLKALDGLVRQAGYHLWRAIKKDQETTLRGVQVEDDTREYCHRAPTHEEVVDAQEVLGLAYADHPDLLATLVAGDSIATWGKRAGYGATAAKVVARECATAAYLYASGVAVADHDHRVLVADNAAAY